MIGFLRRTWNRIRRSFNAAVDAPWLELLDNEHFTRDAGGQALSPLRQSTVWACVERRAEGLAKLDFNFCKKTDKGPIKDEDHHYWDLGTMTPNAYMDGFELMEFISISLDLWGNFFGILEQYTTGSRAGQVKAIHPVLPQNVSIIKHYPANEFETFQHWYSVTWRGRAMILPPGDILHIRSKSLAEDGLLGLSRVAHHRQTIDLDHQQEKYGLDFYKNGGVPIGILSSPLKMEATQKERMRTAWDEIYGRSRAGRFSTAVTDQGVEYKQISMPNSDQEFLESRKFTVTDIARIFNVPSPLVNDLEKATFSNIEQLTLNFVTSALQPQGERVARAWNRQVLLPFQRSLGYHWKFTMNALNAADLSAQATYYRKMVEIGALNQNEVRGYLGLPMIPGGDEYYSPVNLMTDEEREARLENQAAMAQIGQQPSDGGMQSDGDGDAQEGETKDVENMARQVIANSCDRMVAVAAKMVCQLSKKKNINFMDELERKTMPLLEQKFVDALQPLYDMHNVARGEKQEDVTSCVATFLDVVKNTAFTVAGSSTQATLAAHMEDLFANAGMADQLKDLLQCQNS